jgi:hypothetical protein
MCTRRLAVLSSLLVIVLLSPFARCGRGTAVDLGKASVRGADSQEVNDIVINESQTWYGDFVVNLNDAVTAAFSDHSIATFVQSVICTAGPTRNAGVHPGDWFNYSVTIGGNGTLPPGNWLVGLKWDLVQVTDVSGTKVTEQATRHYQNGSETILSEWVDVNTGKSPWEN